MLKIRAKLSAILLFYAERGQSGRNGLQNERIDIVVTKLLLFGERLDNDGSDISSHYAAHRLMIRATFSNPRFAIGGDRCESRKRIGCAEPEHLEPV